MNPSINPISTKTCFHLPYSGFESETDTEEFEKLGQSPIDRQSSNDSKIITDSKVEMLTVSTSTDPIELKNCETLTEVCPLSHFRSIPF